MKEEEPNRLEVVFGPNLKEDVFGAIKDVFVLSKAEVLIFLLRLFRPLSRVGGSPSESKKLDLDDTLSTEVLLLLNEFCGTFEASLLARVSADSSFLTVFFESDSSSFFDAGVAIDTAFLINFRGLAIFQNCAEELYLRKKGTRA